VQPKAARRCDPCRIAVSRGGFHSHIARRTLKARKRSDLVPCKPIPLSASYFLRGDFRQLIGACFPNQNGDLIVCGLTPVLCDEGPDGSISLLTPLTESIEQFRETPRISKPPSRPFESRRFSIS
jgi:hypothetical protein